MQQILSAVHGARSGDTIRRFGPAGIDVAAEVAWVIETELSNIEGVFPIAGIQDFVTRPDPASWAVVTSAPRALTVLHIQSVGLRHSMADCTARMPRSGSQTPMAAVRAENPQILITTNA